MTHISTSKWTAMYEWPTSAMGAIAIYMVCLGGWTCHCFVLYMWQNSLNKALVLCMTVSNGQYCAIVKSFAVTGQSA